MTARDPDLLERAFGFGDEGDWDAMAIILREALEDDENDPDVLCWLGVAERELGLEGMANDHFRLAIENGPEDPTVLATAGNALAAVDDPAAEPALRAASIMAPELPLARLMYGAYLAREGMVSEALEELTAGRALDPEDAVMAMELGVARALSGDLEAAAAEFEASVDLEVGDGWAQVLLGLALIETGDTEHGGATLSWAAEHRPDDVEAQLLAALAMAAVGEEDRARAFVEAARFRAASGDLQILVLVEEQVDLGPEASQELLVTTLAPAAFRERIMTRP